MDHDAKKKILARRAKFMAAALAGVACGKEPVPNPQPCLSVMYIPSDAGSVDASAAVDDAGTPAADTTPLDAEAPPQPCLRTRIQPPQPCLSTGPVFHDAGPPPQPCLSPVPAKSYPQPCLIARPPNPDEE